MDFDQATKRSCRMKLRAFEILGDPTEWMAIRCGMTRPVQLNGSLVKMLNFNCKFLVPQVEGMWSAYFSIDDKDVAAFSMVLIFLPSGILAGPEVEKGLSC